jgi:diguanylate cyclase (GGDEF)-like protein
MDDTIANGRTGLWLVVAGFAVASVATLVLGQLMQISTAGVWLYLPLVLLVTLRWGAVRGAISALAVTLLVLTFLVPPLGQPLAADPRAYLRLLISTLGSLATLFTVAKLNQRRINVERRGRLEAETLADIGNRISASLDLHQILRTTAESAHRLVAADVTYIALTHGLKELEVAAAVGNRTSALQGMVIPAEVGLSGEVVSTGRPVRANWDDGTAESRTPLAIREAMAAEGIVSTLAVPIRRGMEVAGVFWVHSRNRREFTDTEVVLLQRVAIYAAVAIGNADTLAEEQEARAEIEALLAATSSLGAQAQPEQVLRTLIDRTASLLKAERAIYAVPRNGNLVVPATWLKGVWSDDEHVTRKGGILWTAWETGRSHRMNDVANSESPNGVMLRGYARRSQLTVPILGDRGVSLGVLALNNKEGEQGFTARDERLLEAICKTGAAVLNRATETAIRLDAEREAAKRKQEVEALLAAADRLNGAVDPDEVLRQVTGIGAELLAVKRAGIVTNEGDHAMRRFTFADGVWQSDSTRLPFDDSIGGWVIKHAQPYCSNDLTGGPFSFHPASSKGMPTSVLSVPIITRDESVLGSLNLFERRDNLPFCEEDQRLAEGIAHHAAVAMERASLIQELRQREDHLRIQAVTDPLTGLPNRSLFFDRLSHALIGSRRRSRAVAVLFIDLDGFKLVNDSLGHPAGDALLQGVAKRLVECQRRSDTVARLGGDEFAVLLEDIVDSGAANEVADRILMEMKQPFFSDAARGMFVNVSIGISFRDAATEACSAEELIREADIALYCAKGNGKGHAVLFNPSMGTDAVERLELQSDLQRALGRGELVIHYQPLLALQTKSVIGAEALVRWNHPERGLLGPDTFIPAAEATGLILPIGRWILEEACRQAVGWQSARSKDDPFRVSVNLSARQFEQPDLVEQVAGALKQSGLEPSALVLEITETAVIRDPDAAIGTLSALRALGVRVAIDDFGTGYSSLSYLERLKVDILKIDRSFLFGIERSQSTAAIVQATIAMAHVLGIEVTAEGIETEDQLSMLAGFACDDGQGFYLSKPVPSDEVSGEFTRLEAWLQQIPAAARINGGSPQHANLAPLSTKR